MKITSSAFANNQYIPQRYTCDGENINPPLEISGVPEKTAGLILIIDDPDAPAKTWLHWTLWNIEPYTKEIEENSKPENAIEGKTDFGFPGYGGPCPPSGTHRYFFKLYAMDRKLNLKKGASLKELEKEMKNHILERAELVELYKRKQ